MGNDVTSVKCIRAQAASSDQQRMQIN